jgi:ketosteroid isomerase-like protein
MDEEFAALEESFNKAIMENDAEVIAHFLADDWIIVDPDGGLIDKDRFLGVIRSDVLSHDLMKSEEMRCRFYRDTGLVTAITISKGTFAGHVFKTRERASSVYIRSSGEWKCVLTQLTRIVEK